MSPQHRTWNRGFMRWTIQAQKASQGDPNLRRKSQAQSLLYNLSWGKENKEYVPQIWLWKQTKDSPQVQLREPMSSLRLHTRAWLEGWGGGGFFRYCDSETTPPPISPPGHGGNSGSCIHITACSVCRWLSRRVSKSIATTFVTSAKGLENL